MKLPKTKSDRLWMMALMKVAIEEAETPCVFQDVELMEFVLLWTDELAEVLWS